MARPGWTPGPVHESASASTIEAVSHAARSVSLFSCRLRTFSASRTARPTRRSFAARRNARASAVTVRSGGREAERAMRIDVDPCPRRRGAGIVSSKEVGSFSRHPMTSMASAASSRSRTTGAAQAGHAEVQRVVVRDDVGPAPARHDRYLQQLREPQQVGRCPRPKDAAAGDDDRPLGRCKQLDHRADVGVRGSPRCRAFRRDGSVIRDDLVEQVLRERQHDGSRPSGRGLSDGLVHDAGDVARLGQFGRPLGEPADRRDLIDLLERLVTAMPRST